LDPARHIDAIPHKLHFACGQGSEKKRTMSGVAADARLS
jgi:hypothetical protein